MTTKQLEKQGMKQFICNICKMEYYDMENIFGKYAEVISCDDDNVIYEEGIDKEEDDKFYGWNNKFVFNNGVIIYNYDAGMNYEWVRLIIRVEGGHISILSKYLEKNDRYTNEYETISFTMWAGEESYRNYDDWVMARKLVAFS
jgi:hypothetical protein